MIMVGHALQHKQGSYRIYNLRTKKIFICDNVKWLLSKQWNEKNYMKSLMEHDDNIKVHKMN